MADFSINGEPSYVHQLFSGLPDSDEAPRLDPEDEAEVGKQLRAIAEARAQAAVHGRDYVIH